MRVHNGGSNVGINRVPSSPRGTNGKVSILPLVFLIFISSESWWIYSKLDEQVVFLSVEHHFKRSNHVPNISCNAPEQGTSRVYILMIE
ncbi:hypothetical protein RHGRI_018525 [Rhododendron griersonianum]|uniref:Transmembrane protein n=1 Tax=Rhododendron griersonianum TaxID=479676 RepID=A0AAV6K1Y8_9ERIC|nr:hypothetical protein RHGRI_036895 [Rhododendron griersonianum]KAG5523018.1 hypothetical protein RHGRI_034985 [Rhododendron griersonianum]KAG5526344.1 hypothetical protein RHGRI_032579 [Rhododendron griersonianum]KAG5536265.1 hypothetical protein RHGRI_023892 [Rhododendron griersonianum]KAG5536497.1 hypothetical protein RHGRI_024058 [Rhododendron griersonianum]